MHDETGDLLGTDFKLVRDADGWRGAIGVAEGGTPEYEPLTAVQLDTAFGGFRASWGAGGRSTLSGTFTRASLTAVLRWTPNEAGEATFLDRVALEHAALDRRRGRVYVWPR